MKQGKWGIGISLLLLLGACADPTFYDVYHDIPNRSWSQHEKQRFEVHVDDATKHYELWLYIRHTGEYNYTNLFVSTQAKGPKLQDSSHRYTLNLATSDGRWTGTRAGNLYVNRLLLKADYSFPDTGMYTFDIQQNMVDNPLMDITDVGLKIQEK